MTFKERAKSAFLQLMERIPEPKPWNGRVVCVESTCPGIYTAGKIYECRDGHLISNLGTMYPSYGYYTSLKDLQARNITKFIELKED